MKNENIKDIILNQFIDNIIFELQNDKMKKKIDTYIIQPCMCYLFEKFYPYIFITYLIFILLVLITLITLLLIIRNMKSTTLII